MILAMDGLARCRVLGVVGLVACGPSGPSVDAGEEGGASEETQAEGGGPGDGDGEVGDGDGEVGDGDGEAGDGDGGPGDGDGDPPPLECPAPLDATAQFEVDPPEARQAMCVYQGESFDNSGIYELTLDCEGEFVGVRIDSSIQQLPDVGGDMSLDYRVEGAQRWLALRREGGPGVLVLGGVSAARLDPPGTTLSEFFGDPGVRIAEQQPCEGSVEQPCGSGQRLALALSDAQFGEIGHVFDAGSYITNFLAYGYAVEVERAVEFLDPQACEGPGSFQLLATWYSDP